MGADSSPPSHSGVTFNSSASSCITSGRGMVLPLTYWLTWLFQSL